MRPSPAMTRRHCAGYSLRSGFLTQGAGQGATIFKLQEVSRHKSVQVLSEYVRKAELFKDHAGERFLVITQGMSFVWAI